MVTGIETAGLALAVFPLVVGGIQFYADGARTIKEMWRPERALNALTRELEMEKCKFENTCTLLLEDMVSNSHLILLMERPGGPLWGADDLQQKLKSRLRPAAAQCYMEAMEALVLTLQTLQDEFKMNKDEKPEVADRKTLKKQLKRIRIVLSKAEYKELLADITKINSDLATLTGQSKLANSPPQMISSAKHYKRIRNHAINLYGVFKEKFQTIPACACTIPHNANLRLEVRSITQAQKDRDRYSNLRFHVVLSFEINATAGKSISWNWREMGLEPLDGEEELPGTKQGGEADSSGDQDDKGGHVDAVSHMPTATEKTDNTLSNPALANASRLRAFWGGRSESSNASGPTFGLTESPVENSFNLSFRRSGRENRPPKSPRNVSFSLPQPSSTNPISIIPDAITTKQIENLCLVIQQDRSDLSCFGVLTDESNRQYRVWPPREPSLASEPTEALSLESLLARPGVLKKKDRLILGVQLASTVMQLHATEWLDEAWGKKDILFHPEPAQGKGSGEGDINPIIRKPFIRRTFTLPGPNSLPSQIGQEPTKSILMPHNQSLFSLGVILVELWFGRRLEDLRIEADGNGIGGMTEYVTAWRLIREISEEAGEKYGDAVRRCIIGLDHRNANLDTDDFKNEVHIKVVSPLVENLESFCAMDLVELLS